MTKILCIGDVMLDVIVQIATTINYGSDTPSKISTHGGGAAGNVAAWASRSGGPSQIVARVGNDPAGIAVISEFDTLNVMHTKLVIEGASTGVVVVLVDPNGERTMFPETGANSGLTINDLPDLLGFEAVYLSGYALLDEFSRPGILQMIEAISAREIPIFFDPATVGGMSEVPVEQIQSWLSLMNTLFMNEEEATFLTGRDNVEQALDALLEYAPTAIIKRGARGVIGNSRGGTPVVIPAFPTTVIDTTGAGDSFAGGYLAAWISNRELRACMTAGSEVASRCVGIVGARPQVTTAF